MHKIAVSRTIATAVSILSALGLRKVRYGTQLCAKHLAIVESSINNSQGLACVILVEIFDVNISAQMVTIVAADVDLFELTTLCEFQKHILKRSFT